MSDELLDLDMSRLQRGAAKARISRSVRNVSRECRKEMSNSHGYHVLWVGYTSPEQYATMLNAQLAIRRHLEHRFAILEGEFRVRNIATNEDKIFAVPKFVTPARCKAQLLASDLEDLYKARALNVSIGSLVLPTKAQELMDYMDKVANVYTAGLLGVLYMLEEAVAMAGPVIASNMDKQLRLYGKATRYLRGTEQRKSDLWKFRESLDWIMDYQTQVNVVTAANIAYSIYRDLIDPRASYTPLRSTRLN